MSMAYPGLPQQLGFENVKKDVSLTPTPDEFSHPDGTFHVLGSPMFDVISISLKLKTHLQFTYDSPWEIVGFVQIFGEGFNDLSIYERLDDNPEKLSKAESDGILSLTLTDYDGFTGFFPGFNVRVRLKDKIRDLTLIETTFKIDFEDFADFDKVQITWVERQGAKADLCLKHITYMAAVTACVQVKLSKIVEENGQMVVQSDEDVDKTQQLAVTGAVYGKTDHTSITELSEFPNEPVKMTFGTPMNLPRCLFTVPVYSSLEIGIDLEVSDYGIVKDNLKFSTDFQGTDLKDVEVPKGLVCRVLVHWEHEYFSYMEIEEATSHHQNESIKKRKVIDEQLGSSFFCLYKREISLKLEADKMMEVFSIFLGLNKDEVCKIHGTIIVNDIHDVELRTYDKDESHGEKFTCSTILSLQGPDEACFAYSPLELKVDLKVDDKQFCRGFFHWDDQVLRRQWMDKNLCSVIKGELGFVAVNYVIFSSAVEAKILVVMSISSGDLANVSGRIVAEYSDHVYPTYYDKEYFRSVLFSRTPESPARLLGDQQVSVGTDDGVTGIALPMSKSVVCVPNDTSLMVEINLSATVVKADRSELENLAFSRRVDFEIGYDMCYVIENQGCRMHMLVTWGTVLKPPQFKMTS